MEFVATTEELGGFVSRRIGEFSGFLWQPRTFTNIPILVGATVELEETTKLFLMQQGLRTSPLTDIQVTEVHRRFLVSI